ncbi:MAG: hypothetical protein BZY79_06520 [SAR202 cluster bacterium Casp-Chloro-G4]|nr:MAG: hypothetical protein BZY79_06520 [SAR202 cluster bacterium Casp-Chloro-G4]
MLGNFHGSAVTTIFGNNIEIPMDFGPTQQSEINSCMREAIDLEPISCMLGKSINGNAPMGGTHATIRT